MSDSIDPTISAAWRHQSAELADYAWRHLVNRTDVWGAYLPLPRRPIKTRADGIAFVSKSVTAPPVADRGQRHLTPGILERHFAGADAGDVVGLHTTAIGNTSRWGLVEVDKHGEAGDEAANLRAVLHWEQQLRRLGFHPWLSDSNGRGGYHLRIVFDRPVPTGRLYRFLQRLIEDHRNLGLVSPPETFPRQAALSGLGYGNWVRLPGRHHTASHWSRFNVDGQWVSGANAVAFILRSRLDEAHLLPDIPEPPPPPPPKVQPYPKRWNDSGRMSDRDVALKSLAGIPNADLHYDQWLSVGMALHSVDSSTSMLAEWESWSASSNKYTAGECGRCWAAFSSAGRARRYTIATLVYLARQNGCDPYSKPRFSHAMSNLRRVATSLCSSAIHSGASSQFLVQTANRGAAW